MQMAQISGHCIYGRVVKISGTSFERDVRDIASCTLGDVDEGEQVLSVRRLSEHLRYQTQQMITRGGRVALPL